MSMFTFLRDVAASTTQRLSAAAQHASAAYLGGDVEGPSLTYITNKIIVMGFPFDEPGPEQTQSPLEQVANELQTNHGDHFLVVNLSERVYDYSRFDEQVLEFKFPGYPAPPLDSLFNICSSIDAWLKADSANVVAVHCQTGRGRTVTCVAAYLIWARKLRTARMALDFMAKKMERPVHELVIPTQRRYLAYTERMIASSITPSPQPVKIQRVILNGIPRFAEGGTCRPYLQVFKDAKLVHTQTGLDTDEEQLRVYTQEDNSILFPVEVTIQGDILVRVRHVSDTGARTSMLRFGLHTGFLKPGLVRLTKSDLDGAWNSDKFDDDFCLDCVVVAADLADDDAQAQVDAPHDSEFWDRVARANPDAGKAMGRAASPAKDGDEEEDDDEPEDRFSTGAADGSPPPPDAVAQADPAAPAQDEISDVDEENIDALLGELLEDTGLGDLDLGVDDDSEVIFEQLKNAGGGDGASGGALDSYDADDDDALLAALNRELDMT